MRRITLFGALVLLFIFSSCEKKEVDTLPYNLELSLTTSSGCLNTKMELNSTINEYFDFIYRKNSIEIIHNNLKGHCAADWEFQLFITNEKKIIIREVDISERSANCLCYFNISTSILNLPNGVTFEIEI